MIIPITSLKDKNKNWGKSCYYLEESARYTDLARNLISFCLFHIAIMLCSLSTDSYIGSWNPRNEQNFVGNQQKHKLLTDSTLPPFSVRLDWKFV